MPDEETITYFRDRDFAGLLVSSHPNIRSIHTSDIWGGTNRHTPNQAAHAEPRVRGESINPRAGSIGSARGGDGQCG